MMSRCKLSSAALFAAVILLSSPARATPIVTASVSGSPGAYFYSYEINNQTAAPGRTIH
jgi:hypothetical protein